MTAVMTTPTNISHAARLLGLRMVGVAVSAAMAATDAPVWLRFGVGTPLLIAVVGSALLCILFGREPAAVFDGVWSIPVVALMGVLSMLAIMLTLNVFGVALSVRWIVTAVVSVAVVLSVGAFFRVQRDQPGFVVTRPSRRTVISACGVVAALALLGGALACAKTFYVVTPQTPYAVSSFSGVSGLRDTVDAQRRRPVSLTWEVESLGQELSTNDLPANVEVGGAEARGLVVTQLPSPGSDSANHRTFRAEFTAPARTGDYTVRVVTASGVGGDLTLTTQLVVR
ncbi:hypothetical protein [Gordonia sputi]|uniref:hypothetical protein n=1 Tax=Gordonia sputi TaxID=36823 RepID=UPI0036D05448